jgi:hypothetical protein
VKPLLLADANPPQGILQRLATTVVALPGSNMENLLLSPCLAAVRRNPHRPGLSSDNSLLRSTESYRRDPGIFRFVAGTQHNPGPIVAPIRRSEQQPVVTASPHVIPYNCYYVEGGWLLGQNRSPTVRGN